MVLRGGNYVRIKFARFLKIKRIILLEKKYCIQSKLTNTSA